MYNTRNSIVNTKYWKGTPKKTKQEEVPTPNLDSKEYNDYKLRVNRLGAIKYATKSRWHWHSK